MPLRIVKPDVAKAINDLTALLKRDYGCDFSYVISGNGGMIAQYNINGVQSPIPLVEETIYSGRLPSLNECLEKQ